MIGICLYYIYFLFSSPATRLGNVDRTDTSRGPQPSSGGPVDRGGRRHGYTC